MRKSASSEVWIQILVVGIVFSAGVWYLGMDESAQTAPAVQYPPLTGDELPVERVY